MMSSIVDFLEQSDYRLTPGPLRVADLDFELFDAIFIGPRNQKGLVLVINGEKSNKSLMKRHIKAFALAINRAELKRPITVIYCTDHIDDALVSEIAQLFPVIPISPGTESLQESLGRLRPLDLPNPMRKSDSTDLELSNALHRLRTEPFVKALKRAADKSSEKVEVLVRDTLEDISNVAEAQRD